MTDCVKTSYPDLWEELEREAFDEEMMCGLAVIRSPTLVIVLTREAKQKQIKWAGSGVVDACKKRTTKLLHPRDSFEEFIISSKHQSQPWTADDISFLEYLQSPLLLLLQKLWDEKADFTQKFLSTMSHELRTPF